MSKRPHSGKGRSGKQFRRPDDRAPGRAGRQKPASRRFGRSEKPSRDRDEDRPRSRGPVNPNRSKRPPRFGKPEREMEGGERPRFQRDRREAEPRGEYRAE